MPEYRTTDLHIAAYLKARRMEQTGLERSPTGQVTFCFADRETCQELTEELWDRPVTVSMCDYWAAEKSLRVSISQGAPKHPGGRP